jgi:uncharacterized protein YciI
MIRLLSLSSFVFVLAVAGCTKPATTNITENADQAAIDAYNAEAAKAAAEVDGYAEPK